MTNQSKDQTAGLTGRAANRLITAYFIAINPHHNLFDAPVARQSTAASKRLTGSAGRLRQGFTPVDPARLAAVGLPRLRPLSRRRGDSTSPGADRMAH